MDNQLDITNIITGKKKKINIKDLSRKEITAYTRSPHQKFCYSCGELNALQSLFVEVFASNLYGYICTDCNFKGMAS
jgi:hypothetical protein